MRSNFLTLIGIVASALIVVGKVTVAQTATNEDLLDLAKKRFPYESISSEEEKKAFYTFFLKTQNGEKADLTPELKTVADPRDVKILTDPVYAEHSPMVSHRRDRIPVPTSCPLSLARS